MRISWEFAGEFSENPSPRPMGTLQELNQNSFLIDLRLRKSSGPDTKISLDQKMKRWGHPVQYRHLDLPAVFGTFDRTWLMVRGSEVWHDLHITYKVYMYSLLWQAPKDRKPHI